MSAQKSVSTAQADKRPILATNWLIGLLAGMAALALVLLYPRLDLERRLSRTPDTALSVAYLNNLLRSDPNNPQLRLLLAQHQISLGESSKARETLQPALGSASPEVRKGAEWVLWELSELEFSRIPLKDPARPAQLHALKQQLLQVAEQAWEAERVSQLAASAFKYDSVALGRQLYKKLSEIIGDPQQSIQIYDRAAVKALAAGDYRNSSELYMLARKSTKDPLLARRYFFSAIKTLQSGNQPASALEMAERELGELANDQETLVMITNLARAAGRPDRADHYVRQLLRLSLLRQIELTKIAKAWGQGSFLPVSLAAGTKGPELPFDDKIYALGYAVFLENKKQEDAWLVADSAVRQAPENHEWRKRLAEVSEWTGRPKIALNQWLTLARRTGEDHAWQSVLRLAPGLFDDPALIEGLRYEIGQKPNNEVLIRQLILTYERIGEPKPAIAYLQKLIQNTANPEHIELLADLATRAGETEIAMDSWRTLFRDPAQITTTRALRAAVLFLSFDKGKEALHWLEIARPVSDAASAESNIEAMRLTGQLAERNRQDELAIKAFRSLIEAEHAELDDYDALIRLLLDNAPLEAAKVTERAWQLFDLPRHLLQTMTLLINRNQWNDIGRLVRQLDPTPGAKRHSLKQMQTIPEFLRITGAWHQNAGRFAQARHDFQAGLRQAPDSPAMRQALLWLFIDTNDAAAIRQLLAVHEGEWSKDSTMHDSLGNAYQALSLPQVSLQRYLTPQLASKRGDFLWLMNYCDALDQNQQSDRAWRLRRYLLSTEWQAAREKSGATSAKGARLNWLTEKGLDQTRRNARARLMLTQHRGDVGTDTLRELLRLDRDAQGNFSNAAAETAIGWFQDSAEFTAERGFLWHQYAKSHSLRSNRPLWADITVALAEDDRAASGELLETFDERLPRYDRVNAARAVHDIRLAQSAAFEAQHDQVDDNPTHLQLTEALLMFSDHAGLAVGHQKLDGLNELQGSTVFHLAIDPQFSVDLAAGKIRRDSTDNAIVVSPPDETFFSARINWRRDQNETLFKLEQRKSFDTYTPLAIEHERAIDSRISLRIGLAVQQPSQESLALRMAGMKDSASISLRYRPTRMDRIFLEHASERYALQTGRRVGTGQHTSLTFAHTYRQEARDLEFSAFMSNHRYNRISDIDGFNGRDMAYVNYFPEGYAASPNDFLPENFRLYGLRISTDVRYEEEYTRAIRPFASIATTWHSEQGAGYDLRLGLAGSVFGADHLSFFWNLGKSGTATPGTTRNMQLKYRVHY